MSTKTLPILVAMYAILSLVFIYYISMTPRNSNVVSFRNISFTDETGEPKIILFWTKFYKYERWRIDAGDEECGPYVCTLTYDKSLYENASAVMFHHRSSDWLSTLPLDYPRKSWQRWVLYNRESSWWTPKGDKVNLVNNLINWTMGFRRDNDITIPTAAIKRK